MIKARSQFPEEVRVVVTGRGLGGSVCKSLVAFHSVPEPQAGVWSSCTRVVTTVLFY